jgi:hypothetical protein
MAPILISIGRILGGLLAALSLLALLLTGFMSFFITAMPGASYQGPFRPLSGAERAVSNHLERHVRALAGEIGERNIWRPGSMEAAAAYIREMLVRYGYEVGSQEFTAFGRTALNLEVAIPGISRPEEIVLVSAHYDTVLNSPGANDNGSGVAGLLELGRLLAAGRFTRSVRLVCFANEEDPFYSVGEMGSQHYAREARARGERIVAMLSLETMGFYTEAAASQQYPFPFAPFYPDRGNFIAFVGNLGSRTLVRQAIGLFRESTPFPSEGTAAPGWLTGIGWSDHRSFWEQGYPALMLTDTAPFRYPWYHTRLDLPEKIDYDRVARVVVGVSRVVAGLAGVEK